MGEKQLFLALFLFLMKGSRGPEKWSGWWPWGQTFSLLEGAQLKAQIYVNDDIILFSFLFSFFLLPPKLLHFWKKTFQMLFQKTNVCCSGASDCACLYIHSRWVSYMFHSFAKVWIFCSEWKEESCIWHDIHWYEEQRLQASNTSLCSGWQRGFNLLGDVTRVLSVSETAAYFCFSPRSLLPFKLLWNWPAIFLSYSITSLKALCELPVMSPRPRASVTTRWSIWATPGLLE